MRVIAKRDANHSEIVECLRSLGCTVADLGSVGGGFPDIVVGYGGLNVLVEIKDGKKPPSARSLTPDQVEFFAHWKGDVIVVTSVKDCVILRDRIATDANTLRKASLAAKESFKDLRRCQQSRIGPK